MQITKLEYGKRDPSRINVHIEGEFSFSLEQDLVLKYGLHQGKSLAQEEINQYKSEDFEYRAVRKALNWWGSRPRSQQEVYQKLRDWIYKFEELDVELLDKTFPAVTDKLESLGYDEKSFTEWFVRERVRQQKYGVYKLKSDLAGKGVASKISNAVIADNYSEQQQLETKQKVLQKKFGIDSIDEVKDFKQKGKIFQFLKSRGF